MEEGLIALANGLRAKCKEIEQEIRDLMGHGDIVDQDRAGAYTGEVKANIMLAVRHIEDTRMRLGKVCQYADDGVSIYDKA
jgi:hypothetical protein